MSKFLSGLAEFIIGFFIFMSMAALTLFCALFNLAFTLGAFGLGLIILVSLFQACF